MPYDIKRASSACLVRRVLVATAARRRRRAALPIAHSMSVSISIVAVDGDKNKLLTYEASININNVIWSLFIDAGMLIDAASRAAKYHAI